MLFGQDSLKNYDREQFRVCIFPLILVVFCHILQHTLPYPLWHWIGSQMVNVFPMVKNPDSFTVCFLWNVYQNKSSLLFFSTLLQKFCTAILFFQTGNAIPHHICLVLHVLDIGIETARMFLSLRDPMIMLFLLTNNEPEELLSI